MANVSNLCYKAKENMKNLKIICRKSKVSNKTSDRRGREGVSTVKAKALSLCNCCSLLSLFSFLIDQAAITAFQCSMPTACEA